MNNSNEKIKQKNNISDDTLRIKIVPHPFKFEKSPDEKLNELIVEAVAQMGGVGERAEEDYQKSIEKLRSNTENAVPTIVSEYSSLPEFQYLDRWSLIQLLAELKSPLSLKFLDSILASPIPPERSKTPHAFSTRGEEVIIRTSAIEAITRIAAENNDDAMKILLRYSRDETFSIKRAAIQGYLKVGGEIAKNRLLETLPKEDHYVIGIQQTDVRLIPQPSVEEFAKPFEIDDSPKKLRPKIEEQKPMDLDECSDSDKGGDH